MTREIPYHPISAWPMLVVQAVLALIAWEAVTRPALAADYAWVLPVIAVIEFVLLLGYMVLQPNQAMVLVFFGNYRGTAKKNGFFWANPLLAKTRISLRVRNFESSRLKVNDKQGNPIEIAAVVVWRVVDTAQASFDVANYESYVQIQAETAVRHLATTYAYDNAEGHEPTLRGGADEIAAGLLRELQERLSRAGVGVDEARLTHLAYAPEIAGVMLRRQQAEAVVAARTKIVQGAVGMVRMALHELSQDGGFPLSESQKAMMVANLMVVLCGETEVTPVVQAGLNP